MKVNRIGEKKIMNCGDECEIIAYRKAMDIDVRFSTGEVIYNNCYSNFKKGEILSHFYPTVYNKGIIGLEPTKDKNGKTLKSYEIWVKILGRCYNSKCWEKHPTYKGCSVCDEWLYYSNFKKWFDENYYEIDGEKMCVDKDILVKGNKIYSPNTCCIVPNCINCLFIKSNAIRGDLPIGVSYRKNKKSNNYCATLRITNSRKTKFLGFFETPTEAFYAYKKEKEEHIKKIADKYKNYLHPKVYEAMYSYEVNIDD